MVFTHADFWGLKFSFEKNPLIFFKKNSLTLEPKNSSAHIWPRLRRYLLRLFFFFEISKKSKKPNFLFFSKKKQTEFHGPSWTHIFTFNLATAFLKGILFKTVPKKKVKIRCLRTESDCVGKWQIRQPDLSDFRIQITDVDGGRDRSWPTLQKLFKDGKTVDRELCHPRDAFGFLKNMGICIFSLEKDVKRENFKKRIYWGIFGEGAPHRNLRTMIFLLQNSHMDQERVPLPLKILGSRRQHFWYAQSNFPHQWHWHLKYQWAQLPMRGCQKSRAAGSKFQAETAKSPPPYLEHGSSDWCIASSFGKWSRCSRGPADRVTQKTLQISEKPGFRYLLPVFFLQILLAKDKKPKFSCSWR